jgi:2,4-dienoyl-CoA reductase-like NADH-dependent reductase (Old Yellow Enzyme family)
VPIVGDGRGARQGLVHLPPALGARAREDRSFEVVSASDVPIEGPKAIPRPLTIPEIHEYAQLYAIAARNAVHHAGFDGVEIHGASRFLIYLSIYPRLAHLS